MGKTTATHGSRYQSLAYVGSLALSALLPLDLSAQTRPEVRLWQEVLPYYNPAASIAVEDGQLAALYGHTDSRHKYYLILGGMPLELLGGQHEVGAQLLHHQPSPQPDPEPSPRYRDHLLPPILRWEAGRRGGDH